jgi:galactonate dehydratase
MRQCNPGTITKVETIRWDENPFILWVQIHTSEGLVGVGETFGGIRMVEEGIHEWAAPYLIGKNAAHIEAHWQQIYNWANHIGGYAGAEVRMLSAIDLALWDILGQAAGLPIHGLLGGRVRDSIPVYNTCYSGKKHTRDLETWYEDPGALAESLLADGFKAMKIWPWDQFSPQASGNTPYGRYRNYGQIGHLLTLEELQKGLSIVERIRERVGNKIEIMIEGHSRWDLNAAIRIARALEPLQPMWMEDIIQPTHADDLARLVNETRIPQSVSEKVITKFGYRSVLEKQAAHVVMLDLCWTGGFLEGKKIAILADTYQLPVAPHDAVGPVTALANIHFCATAVNAMIMEVVRGFYDGGWYNDVVVDPLPVQNGHAMVWDRPGLGTSIRPDFLERPDVHVRTH